MSLLLSSACAFLASLLLQDMQAANSGESRRMEFRYAFLIKEIPAGAKSVKAWIPLPPNAPAQTVEKMEVEGDFPQETLKEDVYGNRFLLLDLTAKAPAGGGEMPLAIRFTITRRACRALDASACSIDSPSENRTRFLAADPLVPIDGKIAEEAKKVVGDAETPLAKARRIYDHIVTTVKYDKSGQGWGKGDANYACDIRKGNCTDFHSLFIGETRSLKIPARFLMGFSIPDTASKGKIGGYHCWAEFYVEGKGWIPVDASDASKNPIRTNALFGGLDQNRIQFTMGRDVEVPKSKAGKVNFFIYPYVEVNGATHAKTENQFSFRNLPAESL